ncbi:zinc finger BED domain-containing protein RICESLEEPER 2-like protein [Tanacetum coccineum]
MAKNPESDRESDTWPRFDRGIPKLTGYGDGGEESPILKSGKKLRPCDVVLMFADVALGLLHEDNSTQVPETPNISPNLPEDNTNIVEETVTAKKPTNKRQRSPVWEHFERMIVNGQIKAKCNYCKKLLGGDPKNGTTHLKDHMGVCKARRQPDIRQRILAGNSQSDLINYVYNEKDGRNALAKMVILHEYPLSIVDHTGFKSFTRTIQPLFKCPSRNTLKSDIIKLYGEQKNQVIKDIENNQSRVAITTDMWTSSNQKKGFMAITGHFIDNDWILRSKILRFLYVPCPHTSEVLTNVLMDALMEWNVDTKLSTITVDNCTTNDSLIGKIKDKLQLNKLIHDGSHIHMRCSAHILNLIVKIGLNVIKVAIENIRESVSYWTATPKRVEKFEETCRQLKVSFSKRLGLDCQTRWNATYLMLKTALMYKDVFARLKQRDSQYKTLPSPLEWENARVICDTLEVFYEVTAIFSGTRYPTANLYFTKISEIRLKLSEWLLSPNKVVSNMASQMIEKFNEYWGDIHELMGVAAVFDPRNKMEMIKFYFELIYPGDSEARVLEIEDLCKELVNEYQSKTSQSAYGVQDNIGSSSTSSMEVDENLSAWEKHILSQNSVPQSAVKMEFERYLDEGLEPRSQDFDILLWWKLRAAKYPVLQAIARDILAIPVSTVASESAFSASGRLISPHRSRLHPNTIEALMCAQSWLWEIVNNGKPFTSDNHASIFDDYDTDVEGMFDLFRLYNLFDIKSELIYPLPNQTALNTTAYFFTAILPTAASAEKSSIPHWGSPFPIGDGDGDVILTLDGDGDGDGDGNTY